MSAVLWYKLEGAIFEFTDEKYNFVPRNIYLAGGRRPLELS